MAMLRVYFVIHPPRSEVVSGEAGPFNFEKKKVHETRLSLRSHRNVVNLHNKI